MKKYLIYLIVFIVILATIYSLFHLYQSLSIKNSGSIADLKKQGLVEEYLKVHISSLSPQKEVLGGKFQVTNLLFKDDKTGEVYYDDGHVSLKASFNYAVSGDDQVTISGFSLMPIEQAIDTETEENVSSTPVAFSQSGSLVKDEGADGWFLIYDLPGKPASRVMLSTGRSTVCKAVDGPISCDDWQIGDRIKVEGQQVGNIVQVISMQEIPS